MDGDRNGEGEGKERRGREMIEEMGDRWKG